MKFQISNFRFQIFLLIAVLCSLSSGLGITPRDRAVLSKAATSAAVSSITVDSNWGTTSCSGVSGCTATIPSSGTRTLTVPAGNPGTLKFQTSSASNTYYYSKNGGAFTTFTNNATLSVANGDTLIFKIDTDPACLIISGTITVTDNTTAGAVGTAVGSNTGC